MTAFRRLAVLAATLGLTLSLTGEVFAAPTAEANRAFNNGVAAYKAGDMKIVVEDWSKAAEGGHAVAAYLLGQLYEQGKAVPHSEALALRYYNQAAALGQVDAMNRAGLIYLEGNKEIGLKHDYKRAGDLFDKAALAGSPEAQFHLGLMYRQGVGVPLGRSEGLRWLFLSGGKHYVPAYLELARIHFDGDGVVKDRVMGWAFLDLGQRFADPASEKPLVDKAMAKYDVRMKPGEKDAAAKAADDWLAKHEAS